MTRAVSGQRLRRPAGLAARLLTAFVLVVLSGSITAWLVATAVSPGLFRSHLAQAGMGGSEQATVHAELAFRSANERFYRVDAARDRGRGGSGIGHGATFTLTLPPVR
jgi:hypothetical protein